MIKDFLARYSDWVEMIDVRENLMNYHFDWPKEIDQTHNFEDKVCAQIDMILRKKDVVLSKQWRQENDRKWFRDYWTVMFPIQVKAAARKWLPKPVKTFMKEIRDKLIR